MQPLTLYVLLFSTLEAEVRLRQVLAACQVVTALQSVVSRNVHCADAAVVSVTTIQGGELWNVIPDVVKLTGTTRSLSKKAQEIIEERIPQIAQNTSFAFGCSCMCKINQSCPGMTAHHLAL